MGRRNPRIDAYIARSAEFARPILRHLRDLVHETVPEVEEDLRWNSPAFLYKGMFAGMAAFRQHCVFGFWKHEQVVGKGARAKEAMGSYGRITSLDDLPPKKQMVAWLRTAKRLNDEGVKAIRRKTKKPPVEVPQVLLTALAGNRKARQAWDGFSPSHQREYAEWISEAKKEDTRARRLATTLEWLAEGKSRNWKYERC
jgi:uncharacterized protein YdeI (YjbR/CyaY-like superfamily)